MLLKRCTLINHWVNFMNVDFDTKKSIFYGSKKLDKNEILFSDSTGNDSDTFRAPCLSQEISICH